MSNAGGNGIDTAALLVKAIRQHSPMIADSLGLSLSADELVAVERAIVAYWVMESFARDSLPTIGQVLEHMLGE